MQPLVHVEGIAAPLVLDNIDTDQIIPGKELMRMETSGYGPGLFSEWRYLRGREPNPEFILNQPPFDRACVLLAGSNFACGSSREVAVWALRDFGIRCVVAPSFGGIFHANCFGNGLLPVTAPAQVIEGMRQRIAGGDVAVAVDLPAQTVTCGDIVHRFEIGALHKAMLLQGLDAVQLTLQRAADIADFQARDRLRRPWIYIDADQP